MKTLFLLALCFSCAVKKEDKQVIWEKWKGHTTSELKDHPYFKNIRPIVLDHGETKSLIYRDQTHFQTGAYCQSLGGCSGMPMYNCDSTFITRNDLILGFEQNGNCPGLKTTGPTDRK